MKHYTIALFFLILQAVSMRAMDDSGSLPDDTAIEGDQKGSFVASNLLLTILKAKAYIDDCAAEQKREGNMREQVRNKGSFVYLVIPSHNSHFLKTFFKQDVNEPRDAQKYMTRFKWGGYGGALGTALLGIFCLLAPARENSQAKPLYAALVLCAAYTMQLGVQYACYKSIHSLQQQYEEYSPTQDMQEKFDYLGDVESRKNCLLLRSKHQQKVFAAGSREMPRLVMSVIKLSYTQ